jgi:transcriptional regulator with GAF, ATPase, and Fis domain
MNEALMDNQAGRSGLIELARMLGRQTEFREILRLVARHAAEVSRGDLALILMLNPETRETVRTVFRDGNLLEQKEYRDIHIHVGGWIVTNGERFLSRDLRRDRRFAEGLFDSLPVHAVVGVPLASEAIVIGALMVLYKSDPAAVTPAAADTLEELSAIAAPFLRNAHQLKPLFEREMPETSIVAKYRAAGLLGRSARFVELLRAIEAATKTDVRVLLVGNTGTGKELVARAIHRFSDRAGGPFIAVDCGAIAPTLLESELFGHTRGAFTGAHLDRQGLFLEANGGTLFLDEINNLPLDMQAKLLRVLEEEELRPVGSNRTARFDGRVVAASSVPLKELVDEHRFREDLYFRLHVYPILVPDLRERSDDIGILAHHFLVQHAARLGSQSTDLHEGLIDFMRWRSWKGNVRELENFVIRLLTITPPTASLLTAASIPEDIKPELEEFRRRRSPGRPARPLKQQVDDLEAQVISETLAACGWNQSETARRLGTTEKNIRYKMTKLHIIRGDS